jgi:hypothetical protein
MKKLLTVAACLAVMAGVAPRACAQIGPGWGPPGVNPGGRFGPPYGPRPGGLNGLRGLGVSGGQGPFGWQPGAPGVPGPHDPFAGLPPAARKLLDPGSPGYPTVGPPFGPLAGGGSNGNPVGPGIQFGPGAPPLQGPPPIDPKLFVNMPPTSLLKDFEVKPPAKGGGGGPPTWLRWEYAVGVLLVAALAGLLHGLFSRRASAE